MFKSDKQKKAEKNRKEILMSLPGFISKLLLLQSSGLTLEESFRRIAEGYSSLAAESDFFTEKVVSIIKEANATGEDPIILFYKFSRKMNVKELSRVATMLMENRSRGSELWDKLSNLSEDLWAERKRIATENIKLADTKLSFPLALLLLALILVTAAPAMLKI